MPISNVPNKFWITPDGTAHDVLADNEYHIQHVVANPQAHGFRDLDHALEERKKQAEKHAEMFKVPVADIPDYSYELEPKLSGTKHYLEGIRGGAMDIDSHLETAAMNKGSIRGYRFSVGNSYGITFDTTHQDHAIRALKHLLPHLEEQEKMGKNVDVSYKIYKYGKGAPYPKRDDGEYYGYGAYGEEDEVVLPNVKAIKSHIAGREPAPIKQETNQIPIGFGTPSTIEKAKALKALTSKGVPRWQAQRSLEATTGGSWGDSTEYSDKLSIISEMISNEIKKVIYLKEENGLPEHFWLNTDTGEGHNVRADSYYHIQHVVRNPKKFGFNDEEEMRPFAFKAVQHIRQGLPGFDTDYKLESHLMNKGFARGYNWAPYSNLEARQISFDVSSKEHANKTLKHILKTYEGKEDKLKVTANIWGDRGKTLGSWNPKEQLVFNSIEDLKTHVGGETGLQSLRKDNTPEISGFGSPSTVQKSLYKKKLKTSGMPEWQAQREVERAVGQGPLGDSVIYNNINNISEISKPSFKSLFKEMIERTKDGDWKVTSHTQPHKNLGGPYKTKSEAINRLKQIKYFGSKK